MLVGEGEAMTQRKPPNVSFPGWVERQIRVAEARGAFENLPGTGKELTDLDSRPDEMGWVLNYLRRENADIAALLPPALALAKEVDLLPEQLSKLRSEAAVRLAVDDLNSRIRRAHRFPQDGPPIRVWIVDVEPEVARWRADRATPPVDEPEIEVVTALEPGRRTGRWRRRR
jgi:hypothetical protein